MVVGLCLVNDSGNDKTVEYWFQSPIMIRYIELGEDIPIILVSGYEYFLA